MRNALRISVLGFTGAWILACGSGDSVNIPTLDIVSDDADREIELVDRSVALDGALNWDVAEVGEGIDFAAAPEGFYLKIDAEEVDAIGEDGDVPPPGDYDNFAAAWAAVVWADVITFTVVAPPAIAIAVASDGEITQLEPNVWYAENTVPLNGVNVTTHFAVAWVGVGWLAEMRISSDDGTYDDTLWFNGFLAYGGGLGWWDFYDANGDLGGVVEWIADGQGNAQFGIAALTGDEAGSWLSYAFLEGTALVEAHSGPDNEDAWVFVDADQSGEVRLPDYNGGEPACWDIDLINTPCEGTE